MALELIQYYKLSKEEYDKLKKAVASKHEDVLAKNKKIKSLEARVLELEKYAPQPEKQVAKSPVKKEDSEK